MRKVREVLRSRYALGVSERQIAASVGVSRSTLGVSAPARRHWHHLAGARRSWMTPSWSAGCFTPAALEGHPERPQPDRSQVHKELKRRGVTLVLLWEEYRAGGEAVRGLRRRDGGGVRRHYWRRIGETRDRAQAHQQSFFDRVGAGVQSGPSFISDHLVLRSDKIRHRGR
jgi:transposase